jgi:hypothetical protein
MEIQQRTHDYTCHGTTPLIASLDVLVDKIAGRWFMETILIRLSNDDWLLCSWTLFAGTIRKC